MIRALSLAAVFVAGLAFPAIADTSTNGAPQATATKNIPDGNPFSMEDARQHLMRQGYTSVSTLVKDANGKWVGSGTKDGRTVPVAVGVKGRSIN
jgi:putative membrane protein